MRRRSFARPGRERHVAGPLLLFAVLLLAIGGHAGPAPAADQARPARSPLGGLGVAFEEARLLGPEERVPALAALDGEIEALARGHLTSDERTALRFLAAEIQFERGEYAAAAEGYAKVPRDGDFAADAAFARIRALEAAGRDGAAEREWIAWMKRYPQSPLLGEVRLARAWNALRGGRQGEAEKLLKEIASAHPWMANDTRVLWARAAGELAAGHPDAALAALQAADDGAPTSYLRALAEARRGAPLKAAALFQETADRYPDSPLRDPALLAKANVFLQSRDYRSAAQEFTRVAARARDQAVGAEAELRGAACVFLAGEPDSALIRLTSVVASHAGTEVAARGQFLIGEIEFREGRHEEAIVDLNRVLTSYFEHAVAASAQYRVARCLDALGRGAEATGSYQAVVKGYPLAPEAPAAAYMAGVGLLAQAKPLAAAPYFQLVIDRYAPGAGGSGALVFASPEHQELVEAALCLLELAYHRAGNLGQLAGAPHLLLARMPESRSPWRAHALLFDADALAALGRYADAEQVLDRLFKEFPDHAIGAAANRLLAWVYARQGQDARAIATEERLVARYAETGGAQDLGAAYLHIAHARFNQKEYAVAAAAYEDFTRRFPAHPERFVALYQAGLCYMRLDQAGDAIDRWESIVASAPEAPIAERAWARAGDLYFQAEQYPAAKRCYEGLLAHFAGSTAAAVAMLRLAQCEYNAGDDRKAIEGFARTTERYPDSPVAREAARGTERALYRLGQAAGGTAVLAELVARYPTSAFAADAQFQIGRQQYEGQEFAAAAESFRTVVSQFPGYSAADRAQYLMAESYARAGDAVAARAAYEQFIAYFPVSELSTAVRFQLGMLHFAADETMQAAVMFTGVLEDSLAADMAAAARFNLALCQRRLGRPEEALATLERYRSEHPGDERAALVAAELASLHAEAGEQAAAAAEYEQALAAAPAAALRVEILSRLGQCRETSGDVSGALRAYEEAAAGGQKDDPFRLTALARAAALYEQKGDRKRASAAYRDIAQHAADSELAEAAANRAAELGSGAKGRTVPPAAD